MPAVTSTLALELVGLLLGYALPFAVAAVFAVQAWRWIGKHIKAATWVRLALLACVMQTFYIGGTKIIPEVGDKIGNFVYWRAQGGIEDPTGIVAEYAEAAAVDAFEAETAGIIGVATGALASVSSDVTDLDDYVRNRDLQLIYLAADAPRDMPGMLNHNIAITAERQSCTGGVMSVWFRYSRELSDAAVIGATVKLGGSTVTLASHTNSFPTSELINGSPCYRYDYDLRPLVGTSDVVVIAPYEAGFGGAVGDGIPLSTPADIEVVTGVVTNRGLTGWVAAPHMSPLMLRAEGGIVVEAMVNSVTYSGINLEEVTL